jgi:hypothetical protein
MRIAEQFAWVAHASRDDELLFAARRESLFRRDAETMTRDACATQKR